MDVSTVVSVSFGRRFRDSIFSTLFLLFFLVYPNIVEYLNPPPQIENTKLFHGVVKIAQKKPPNIFLKLEDGSIQELDFPGGLQLIYSGKRQIFSGLNDMQVQLLNGCTVEVQVDKLRWAVLPTNPRIWSLKCKSSSISYEQMVDLYKKNIDQAGLQIWMFSTSLFMLFFVLKNDITSVVRVN